MFFEVTNYDAQTMHKNPFEQKNKENIGHQVRPHEKQTQLCDELCFVVLKTSNIVF